MVDQFSSPGKLADIASGDVPCQQFLLITVDQILNRPVEKLTSAVTTTATDVETTSRLPRISEMQQNLFNQTHWWKMFEMARQIKFERMELEN